MMLLALIVGLGVGFLIGEHAAARRYNRVLWQHQTALDWAILRDLEESNKEAREQLDRLEGEVGRFARTLH